MGPKAQFQGLALVLAQSQLNLLTPHLKKK